MTITESRSVDRGQGEIKLYRDKNYLHEKMHTIRDNNNTLTDKINL